jgi:hypothetical protein
MNMTRNIQITNMLANSVNRQRMLVIDGNSEDDRQTEDKVQRGE